MIEEKLAINFLSRKKIFSRLEVGVVSLHRFLARLVIVICLYFLCPRLFARD
ncbi:hypothetical protein Hanom_Chr09g00850441 [Helianthus anomalus]